MKLFTIIFVAALAGVGLGFAATVAEFGFQARDPSLSGVRRADGIGMRPRLELVEDIFDFGTMYQNESSSHTFVLRNTGFSDLEIEPGKPTCKCTVSKVSQKTIPPGETSDVTLTWKTGTSKGRYAKWAPVKTNDPARPRIRLELRGVVIPEFDFVPPSIYTATTSKTQRTEFDAKLYFFLESNVQLLGHELSNNEIAEFFEVHYEPIAREQIEDTSEQNEAGIKKHALCGYNVHVAVLPGLKRGPYHQGIIFKSSVETKAPLRLTLNGEVRDNIEIYGPNWHRPSHSLAFGKLKQGTSKQLPLAISAIGEQRDDLTYEVKEKVPADLKVEFGERHTLPGGKNVQTRMLITVPEDAAVCDFSGETDDDWGRVVLSTSHPDYPDVVLRIKLTVTSE